MNRTLKFRAAILVEDQAEARAWLSEVVLDAFGPVPIHAFSTAGHALTWLRSCGADARRAPTIGLIDLMLPDGTGIDLIRELTRSHLGATPVVVSAHDDDASIFDALAAGAQGYLLKKERPERLVQTLRLLEQGEPPLSPSIARRMLAHFQQSPPRTHDPEAVELTARERDVLSLIGRGLRLSEVAEELGLTRHTVAGYVKMIYSKLDIASRAEAAIEAMKRGLI